MASILLAVMVAGCSGAGRGGRAAPPSSASDSGYLAPQDKPIVGEIKRLANEVVMPPSMVATQTNELALSCGNVNIVGCWDSSGTVKITAEDIATAVDAAGIASHPASVTCLSDAACTVQVDLPVRHVLYHVDRTADTGVTEVFGVAG